MANATNTTKTPATRPTKRRVEFPKVGFASLVDAAEFLNCSARTVRRMVDRGELPRVDPKFNRVRIRWADLHAFERRTVSQAEPTD
jgi:excisionase family DNA binding protein